MTNAGELQRGGTKGRPQLLASEERRRRPQRQPPTTKPHTPRPDRPHLLHDVGADLLLLVGQRLLDRVHLGRQLQQRAAAADHDALLHRRLVVVPGGGGGARGGLSAQAHAAGFHRWRGEVSSVQAPPTMTPLLHHGPEVRPQAARAALDRVHRRAPACTGVACEPPHPSAQSGATRRRPATHKLAALPSPPMISAAPWSR